VKERERVRTIPVRHGQPLSRAEGLRPADPGSIALIACHGFVPESVRANWRWLSQGPARGLRQGDSDWGRLLGAR